MHLLLRRGQRDDGWLWSSITFGVYAQLDLTAEEQTMFDRYRLGSFVVYDSLARTEHADAAYRHFEDASNLPLLPDLQQFAGSLWSNVLGITNAALMALSLRITFADLVAGQHIECDDLEAILVAADTIQEQCQLLAAYLDATITFDGREELHEY